MRKTENGGGERQERAEGDGVEAGRRGGLTGTHMGVQREVEVPPQLLDGTATPVFKHM